MTSREHRGRCFFSCSLHKREVPLVDRNLC
nr:MAG TPA: hypothetical protein [Inoviridae sp.]